MAVPVEPRTFFLNELQELAPFAKEGGGQTPKYDTSDWQARIGTLRRSFDATFRIQDDCPDPLAAEHHFVAVVPATGITKISTSKKEPAKSKRVDASPAFGGSESKLFQKLGLDLVGTLPDARALVHVGAPGVARLLGTLTQLPQAPQREQARWVNLQEFAAVRWQDRVDAAWLSTLDPERPTRAVIRFQPLLGRVDVQKLLGEVNRLMDQRNTRLLRAERTFSGQYWCGAMLNRTVVERLARAFPSVRAIHEPLMAAVAAEPPTRRARIATPAPLSRAEIDALPSVAVLDTGIPANHPALGPYRRSGYRSPDHDDRYSQEHGTRVASLVVFGEVADPLHPPLNGTCRVVDAVVGPPGAIEFDRVVEALTTIANTAPDVRVFNMSFDADRLNAHADVKREAFLLQLEDMDNFAFERDVVLVVAAGNTAEAAPPDAAYPLHLDDARWELGVAARSFNAAVVGAFARTTVVDAVAGQRGFPSPFTRVGPGLANSPVPGFGAPGGDWDQTYRRAEGLGLGVWVCGTEGLWEDRCGTSYAAPLVAREAALAFQHLRQHCPDDAAPFAGTVRAWMHLVATLPTPLHGSYRALAERTLGRGFPSSDRLSRPITRSAVFIWQTILPNAGQVCRVQVPIPERWLREAKHPRLRVVSAWNTPVNAALKQSWAARRVSVRVRPFGGEDALRGGGTADGAYPIVDRTFNIAPAHLEEKGFLVADAMWIVEAEYAQVGAYVVGRVTPDAQRVGVVLELFDADEDGVSPQAFVQALPVAAQMKRLSLPDLTIQTPIPIR